MMMAVTVAGLLGDRDARAAGHSESAIRHSVTGRFN